MGRAGFHIGAFRQLTILSLLLLTGCATYQARPLPKKRNLAHSIPAVLKKKLSLPPLRHEHYDPAKGLNGTEVAMLAVVNNPQLTARRSKLGIAKAQLFAAHLFPDPQFSFSFDHPTSNGPGLTNAHSVGLSYDLMALVSHNAGVDSARAHRQEINLELLWQEWQVAQKARLLYYKLQAQQQQVQLLNQSVHNRWRHYEDARHQVSLGNITLERLSTELTGYADIESQYYQAQLNLTDTRHQLNALLGLAPSVKLQLRSPSDGVATLPHPLPTEAAQLVPHRADLLALKAGYQSQEANVRKAILHQFPSISLGFNQASDTSNVHTLGLGIQLNLPLWDANRGAIAVQRATRDALRQDYQTRIDETMSDLDRVRSRFRILLEQYQRVEATLPTLRQVQTQASKAYQAGNFNSLSYLNIEDSLLKKETEAIDLRMSLRNASLDIETLLGWPIGQADASYGNSRMKEK